MPAPRMTVWGIEEDGDGVEVSRWSLVKRSSVGIVCDWIDWMRFCGESDLKHRDLRLRIREKDRYV